MIRTSRHAVSATSAGGLAFSVTVREHTVLTDQPIHGGGEDSAPTPLELLSVALASCIALYVRKHCLARSLNADNVAVEVKPLWREDRITRFDVLLDLPVTIPATEYEMIARVARTCPVHNTLAHAPEITVQVGQL